MLLRITRCPGFRGPRETGQRTTMYMSHRRRCQDDTPWDIAAGYMCRPGSGRRTGGGERHADVLTPSRESAARRTLPGKRSGHERLCLSMRAQVVLGMVVVTVNPTSAQLRYRDHSGDHRHDPARHRIPTLCWASLRIRQCNSLAMPRWSTWRVRCRSARSPATLSVFKTGKLVCLIRCARRGSVKKCVNEIRRRPSSRLGHSTATSACNSGASSRRNVF